MTRVKPALRREDFHWGIHWVGTACQLIAAGVVSSDMLDAADRPHPRGRRRAAVLLASGRFGRIYRPTSSSGRWTVWEEFHE
jgi:hypothetical protein